MSKTEWTDWSDSPQRSERRVLGSSEGAFVGRAGPQKGNPTCTTMSMPDSTVDGLRSMGHDRTELAQVGVHGL